jgi:hypothetical protein
MSETVANIQQNYFITTLLFIVLVILLVNTFRISELYKLHRKSKSLMDLEEMRHIDPYLKDMYRKLFLNTTIPNISRFISKEMSNMSFDKYYAQNKDTEMFTKLIKNLSKIIIKVISIFGKKTILIGSVDTWLPWFHNTSVSEMIFLLDVYIKMPREDLYNILKPYLQGNN